MKHSDATKAEVASLGEKRIMQRVLIEGDRPF
jgi:hypothetical protein